MRIIAIICFFLASTAQAIPLDSWTTWSTNQPYVSKQVPPNALVARGSGTNSYYVLEVNPTTGDIPVSLSGGSISINYSGVPGSPPPGFAAYVAGTDGTNLRGIKTDTNGELQVDVLSSALPTGAATETTLSAINTKTPALGQATMANSSPVVLASNQSAIPVTQSGTWTVQPGNTANTTPWLTSISQGGNTAAVTAGGALTVTNGNFPSTVSTNTGAADSGTLRTTEGSRSYSDSAYKDYGAAPVTTGAWVQIIASTAAPTNLLCITDTSGQIMELGNGGSGSETRAFLIAPGWSGCIPIRFLTGTRISVRAVTATANSGYLTISGLN